MINLCLIKSNIEGEKDGDVGGIYTDWDDITSVGRGYYSYVLLSILLSHSIIIYYLQIYNEDG